MCIIVCGGIKGGSGKTTLATNFAVMRSARNDVLLIDADEQGTSSDFSELRAERKGTAGYTTIKLSGTAVRTQSQRLWDKYDDIIIDTGGRDTTSQRAALTIADLLLVPFIPRSFDIWTIDQVAGLVDEMRAANPRFRACSFLNRSDPRGPDNDEAAELVKEHRSLTFLSTSLGSRKAFGNAAAEGLGVTELKPDDLKASLEIMNLYSMVFALAKEVMIGEAPPPRKAAGGRA